MNRSRTLLVSSVAMAMTAALMLTAWNTLAQQAPAPAALVPKSAGEAIKAGWKVIAFSSTRLVPLVPSASGGIHHVYGALSRDFLLQKGTEVILCATWTDNDTPNHEWTEPDKRCGLVK